MSTCSINGSSWDVERLWELSKELPVEFRPLEEVLPSWRLAWHWERKMSLGLLFDHIKRIESADLDYPIILSEDGAIMDGTHRLVKAHLLKNKMIKVVQFKKNPPPDYPK